MIRPTRSFHRRRKRLYLPAVCILLLLAGATYGGGYLFVSFDRYFLDVDREIFKDVGRNVLATVRGVSEQVTARDLSLDMMLTRVFSQLESTNPHLLELAILSPQGRYLVTTRADLRGRNFLGPVDLLQVVMNSGEMLREPENGEEPEVLYLAAFALAPGASRLSDAGDVRERLVLMVRLRVDQLERSRELHWWARRFLLAVAVVMALTSVAYFLGVSRYYAVNRALDEMEGYADILVDNLSSAVISLDPQGRVLRLNQLARDLFQVEEESWKGKGLETLLPGPKNLGVRQEILQKVRIRQGDVIIHVGEVGIPVGLRAHVVLNPTGEPAGKVVIFEDEREIHDLKMQVQRSDRLASLGRMASMIAHEVRNPLSTIGGHMQMVKEDLLQQEWKRPGEPEGLDRWIRALDLVVGEIERLNKVVSELLHFSAPVVLDLEPTDINEVIRESLDFVASDAMLQKIHLETNLDPTLPSLPFDGGKLKQILLNIYLNAFDAMAMGGTLTVSSHYHATRGRWSISVEDTGCGIPPENLHLLFDPYFTTKKTGSGLGLSIVHNTVETLRGTVQVDSTVGKGTRFTLVFAA